MQPTSWQSVIQSGRLPDAEVKRGRAARGWILPQDPMARVHTWQDHACIRTSPHPHFA